MQDEIACPFLKERCNHITCSGLGAGVAYLISNFGYSENYSQLAGDAHYSICPIFGFCSFSRSKRFCNLSVAIFFGIRLGWQLLCKRRSRWRWHWQWGWRVLRMSLFIATLMSTWTDLDNLLFPHWLQLWQILNLDPLLLADPSSNVTFTYTNNNRPQISAGNTAQNSVSNVNNDRDDNDSNSNNNLNNTGNNTTINNNGRRKRSLRRIIEKFRKKKMTSIYERLIGDFQTLKNNTKSVI